MLTIAITKVSSAITFGGNYLCLIYGNKDLLKIRISTLGTKVLAQFWENFDPWGITSIMKLFSPNFNFCLFLFIQNDRMFWNKFVKHSFKGSQIRLHFNYFLMESHRFLFVGIYSTHTKPTAYPNGNLKM